MRYPLATNTWGDEEREVAHQVIASGMTTMGEETEAYEREFAEHFGCKYAVAVNSGSSANLLMVAAQFYRQNGVLRPGDEVIVPAMGWSTTYAPLHQYGLRLRFVDVSADNLCLGRHSIWVAMTKDTRAIMAVNLLGSSKHLYDLRGICRERGLVLLEDNCEGMGALCPTLRKHAGTMGQCGSFSTFFSHHLNTMEGGVIATDDEETYHILLSLRSHGWTRGQPKTSRFYRDNDQGWEFVLPGYNVRPTEVSSAVGRVQLRKLDTYMEYRRANAELFYELFKDMEDVWIPKYDSWGAHFGFAFVLTGSLIPKRDALRAFLEARGVENRPIISGNVTWHHFMRHFDVSRSKPGHNALRIAQSAHCGGIMIGNHNHDASEGIRYVRECVGEFMERLS